ncbi:transmembrane protease serine 9-like [Amblyomma americanum]
MPNTKYMFYICPFEECGLSDYPRLIINGSAAVPGQFPWVVRVRTFLTPNLGFGCGGTIITRRHVLTAAHCVKIEGKKVLKVDVLYGDPDVTRATQVDVEKCLPHQDYNEKPPVNDIAILLVKEPFQFSDTVKPACLPPGKLDIAGKRAVTPGWGMTLPGGPSTNHLQYTTLKVLPDIICWMVYRNKFRQGSMLCTDNRLSTPCQGDSGGPLFVKVNKERFVQAGITSFGDEFCRRIPGVFTRVDAFMPWIKENIGNHMAYEDVSVYAPPIDPAVPLMEPYAFSSESTDHDLSEPYLLWRLCSRARNISLCVMVNILGVSFLLAAGHLLSAQELELNEKGCGQTISQYIVNGTLAKKDQYPWMVFLKVHFPSFDSRCGGSIITRRHVLTAGHCTLFLGKEVVKIDVVYGETDINRGTKLKVVKIRRHSEYSAVPLFNDIAVLLVDKPFPYAQNAKPICVPLARTDFFNKEAVVAGWGRLSEDGLPTDRLMYTVVKILPNDICAETNKYLGYRKDISYCAYGNETGSCQLYHMRSYTANVAGLKVVRGRSPACTTTAFPSVVQLFASKLSAIFAETLCYTSSFQGDSGGPLFVKAEAGGYVQAGIVSHGMGCAGPPGVYVRVDAYAEWIEASVRSDEGYTDLDVENAEQPPL